MIELKEMLEKYHTLFTIIMKPLNGRTLGPTRTWLCRSRTAKGRQPDKGRQTKDRAKKSWGCPEQEENVDKWWKPAGGGAMQVDVCSVPRRDGERKAGAKRVRSGVNW